MKTLLVTLGLAVAAVSTTQAEHYRPSVVRDTTIVGAVAGALIGGHNGDRWAEGALIGAAAGAIVGTAVDHSRPVYRQRTIQPVVVAPCAPTVVTRPAPRVVIVDSAPAPRVVYVETHAPAVVVRRPMIHLSFGSRHGYRYHHHHHDHHRRHGHGHRHRSHGRW